MQVISIKTNRRNEMLDVTSKVRDMVKQSKVKEGLVLIYVPHTTAGLTINENADPSVVHDILLTLSDLIPHERAGYQHSEGNSDAHVKSSLVGASETVIIKGGRLCLGTWQGIYFCEFDGPRHRELMVHISGT